MAQSTSIKLRDGLKDRLRAIADDDERSVNWLMNTVLEEYADRREQRKAYLAEVERRHREYRETGLHLTQEEADTWIDGLLRGEDPPIPEPHH
ncbi:MAG TPA: CopG family transcriptional regulator [Devosia sp.]|jgi:predicted transcriptional regulator|nr:CopG family transcriptional regulator [Devosia sp.]